MAELVAKGGPNRDLSGVDLKHADLSVANLSGANLWKTRYDAKTQWPDGFDVAASGAVWVK